MRQSYCNRCHAMIWWGVTRNGKRIPLEEDGWAIPNKGGQWFYDELGRPFRGVRTADRIPKAIKAYSPHAQFCPFGSPKPKPKKSAWEIAREEARTREAAKRVALDAKKAEKARVAKAEAEFEARQYSMFG